MSFKPSLTCYEINLECLMLPMSSMFCCKYSKNYSIRTYVEEVVIMNKVFFSLNIGCHMDLIAIF